MDIFPWPGLASPMDDISDADFDKLVAEVWAQLLPVIPVELKEHFHKIYFLIENQATPEQIRELGFPADTDPLEICGMNAGVPLTQESLIEPPLFPTQIYLFRDALLEQADFDGSPAAYEDLREEIAITLLHEVGHFFGLDEDDLERLGFD
jgi:predicted Zn-dependent protease with MMP-like domain